MLLQSASAGFCIDAAHSSTADYRLTKCSMYCRSGFTFMLTTALSSSTPTWVSAEVVNSFDKRPWPPPSQIQVLTEQGTNSVVVGNLLAPEPGGLWPKLPWPPPQSTGIWLQLSASYVLRCAVHQCRVTFFHCMKYQEGWKHWLELLQGAVQDELNCRTVHWLQSFRAAIILLHLINDRRAMLLLSVSQWGLIIPHASMLKRVSLVGVEHLVVTVTSNMQPLFQCCPIAVARIRVVDVSATLMETGILQITVMRCSCHLLALEALMNGQTDSTVTYYYMHTCLDCKSLSILVYGKYLVTASLVHDGNQQSCYGIYRDAHSSALELSLQKLGIEKLTKDNMQQWVASNMEIGTWTHIMQITVKKEPQLLGFSNDKLLVGGTIYARPINCFSLDAMEAGDYPYVLLLKHPWPPPVLLHLPLAGAVLRPTQWPSFCCYGAANKSTLLLFRLNPGPNSIPKLVEGSTCLLLWFSVHLTAAIQVAQLAFKNQRNKQLQQSIMVFVGSPVIGEKNLLEVIKKNLKKNNVALAVVYLGEFDDERPEFTDDGLDGVVDDDTDKDYKHEAEDIILAASTVQNAAAPLALPQATGRQLSKKESKQQAIAQFPWDPGGSELLHRLGGKPKLKKGGMSGTTHGWAFIWAVALGLVEQVPDGPSGRHLQREHEGSTEGIEQLIRTDSYLLSAYYSSSSSSLPSLYPDFLPPVPSRIF